ncbi:hypothetical protein BDZ91DRAFT_800695 [Kalaharituber pfeilii]|nr:hypothetical protein BDZ91DRAFT_800695 [Kalaharituber pfeilii]
MEKITVKDIEEGRVDTQQIIDFIEKSKAMGYEEIGEHIGESITVAQKRNGRPTVIRSTYDDEMDIAAMDEDSTWTMGTKQPTVEDAHEEGEDRTRGDSYGYTPPPVRIQVQDSQGLGGVRPETPDRPRTPDVEEASMRKAI